MSEQGGVEFPPLVCRTARFGLLPETLPCLARVEPTRFLEKPVGRRHGLPFCRGLRGSPLLGGEPSLLFRRLSLLRLTL